MANEISVAEKNATAVSYDVGKSHIDLDMDFVKKYLTSGKGNVGDQEIIFFMNLCKAQKLNPLTREAYLIKYDEYKPAQVVVGKDAYLIRAYSNPNYLSKEDGITVISKGSIIQKAGVCKYPGEELIGGWCRIHYLRGGAERTEFREVSLEEYGKQQATWKSMPATMVNKVAICQCIREAFPKEFEGLYSEDEMIASGAIPTSYEGVDKQTGEVIEVDTITGDTVATYEQRQEMCAFAAGLLGKGAGEKLKQVLQNVIGRTNASGITLSEIDTVKDELKKLHDEAERATVIESDVAIPSDAGIQQSLI